MTNKENKRTTRERRERKTKQRKKKQEAKGEKRKEIKKRLSVCLWTRPAITVTLKAIAVHPSL